MKSIKVWLKGYWSDALRIATLLITGVLLIIGINALNRTVALAKQNQELGVQIKILSNQTRQLSQDNKKLGMENQAYIKCMATIFAKFTQDQQPVNIEDLNSCTVTEDSKLPVQLTSPAQTNSKQSSNPQGSNAQTSQNSTSQQKSQPPSDGGDNSSNPGPVEQVMDTIKRIVDDINPFN